MKIVVIGGSRGIGLETVKAALKAGHEVSAFSRNPKQITITDKNLRLIKGDALSQDDIEKAIKGQDVVVCALGLTYSQAIGPPIAKRSYILSEGVSNIITAMQDNKAKRLLCITAIGTGDSKKDCNVVTRLVLRVGLRWLFQEKGRQEELIKASDLDWTIVRPTSLTNGRSKPGITRKVKSGLFTHISRSDVALTMINMIENRADIRKTVIISYKTRFGDSIRWTLGYFGLG